VSLKRLLWLAVIAFLIWWAIEQPEAAGHAVKQLGGFLSHSSRSIAAFLRSA
jgi:hypothetical protein